MLAKTLVSMEQSYVSAAFFRHLTKERLQRHQAEQLLADGGLCMLHVACGMYGVIAARLAACQKLCQEAVSGSSYQKAAEL